MPPRKTGPKIGSQRRARGVRLDVCCDEGEKEIPELKWIHLATEGEYNGHHQGPFELTREVFTTMVKNFRASPQYTAGADGKGSSKVVPFDYEHASEMFPAEGTIPTSGAPAPAWLYEIELRDGPDGEAQLWGLAKLGKKVRAQIAEDEYAWVSIAFGEGTDWKTGEKIGPVLTSVAFTNHPFMRDLDEIAASVRAGAYDAWQASTMDDALAQLRRLLGLPLTATAIDVQAELSTLLQWAAAGTAPVGVDIDAVLGAIKTIFGLPTTSDLAIISDAVGKAVATLVSIDPQGSEATGLGGKTQQEPQMPLSAQLATIAKILATTNLKKVRVMQSDEDVAAAVEETVAANGDLEGLLAALGFPDAASALKGIPELRAAQTKIGELHAQITELLGAQQEMEQMQESNDVAAAVAAKAWPAKDDALRKSLCVYRASLLKEHGRKEGRAKFLTEYGVTEADKAYLLTTLVAAPQGRQVQAPQGRELRDLPIQPRESDEHDGKDGTTIDLRALPGANAVERTMNWLRANKPELKGADFHALFNAARELRHSDTVRFLDVEAAAS